MFSSHVRDFERCIAFSVKVKTTLREINVMETQVGAEVGELAASLGVKMEISYPGKPIPGAIYSLY